MNRRAAGKRVHTKGFDKANPAPFVKAPPLAAGVLPSQATGLTGGIDMETARWARRRSCFWAVMLACAVGPRRGGRAVLVEARLRPRAEHHARRPGRMWHAIGGPHPLRRQAPDVPQATAKAAAAGAATRRPKTTGPGSRSTATPSGSAWIGTASRSSSGSTSPSGTSSPSTARRCGSSTASSTGTSSTAPTCSSSRCGATPHGWRTRSSATTRWAGCTVRRRTSRPSPTAWPP